MGSPRPERRPPGPGGLPAPGSASPSAGPLPRPRPLQPGRPDAAEGNEVARTGCGGLGGSDRGPPTPRCLFTSWQRGHRHPSDPEGAFRKQGHILASAVAAAPLITSNMAPVCLLRLLVHLPSNKMAAFRGKTERRGVVGEPSCLQERWTGRGGPAAVIGPSVGGGAAGRAGGRWGGARAPVAWLWNRSGPGVCGVRSGEPDGLLPAPPSPAGSGSHPGQTRGLRWEGSRAQDAGPPTPGVLGSARLPQPRLEQEECIC